MPPRSPVRDAPFGRIPTDEAARRRLGDAPRNAHPIWQEAKETDDGETFAQTFERLLDLKREYAEHVDPDADPYAVLFADYEPYLDLATAEHVLKRLRDRLVPLIDEIRESDADPYQVEGTFPEDDQMALAREALETLQYHFEHGRIDTAPHPFSSGTQFDARVTTRFDEEEPLDSLGATIHEFGHASYTQGLPKDDYGTPLGRDRGMTVHESQSRLWENHVGRSEAFWDLFVPRFNAQYGTRSQSSVTCTGSDPRPDHISRSGVTRRLIVHTVDAGIRPRPTIRTTASAMYSHIEAGELAEEATEAFERVDDSQS